MSKYTEEELRLLHRELYEILEATVRVCEKYDIAYFVIGGTAIGALYDKAILPWDDDIDIGMTRENYDRFLEVAQQELSPRYFVSWIGSDPHTPYSYTKVKKNNTLFVEQLYPNVPMHQGIFIDIFPFDRIPDNALLRRVQFEAVNFLKCCLIGKECWQWKHFGRCEIENPGNRGPIPCLLNRIADTLFTKKFLYRMMVAVQSAFNGHRTKYYNNVFSKTDHVTVESLENLVPVPFGPLTLSAPRDMEAFLRYNYPTLHRYTPEEQENVCTHYPLALSFDTTSPSEKNERGNA